MDTTKIPASQLPITNSKFWEKLPHEEVVATVASSLSRHAVVSEADTVKVRAPQSVSQLLISGQEFWGRLPREEVDATVMSPLSRRVSFKKIIEACEGADDLVVDELQGVTLVGLKTDDMVQPDKRMSLESFMSENFYQWVEIPNGGCTIEYTEVDQCNGGAIVLPRLKELEPGRESDPSGLLFAIADALGLARVYFSEKELAATYY